MTALVDAMDEIFGPQGWLVSQGRLHLPEQLEYAKAVARWLSGEASRPVGLFEGDTGTGKTLGYLFPMILHWVATGERCVIATHTVALQHQLRENELPLVEGYLVDKGLPLPVVQQRLGMRHYVDPRRASALLEGESDSDGYLSLFVEWAAHSAAHGAGLLDEWTESYGALPEGVTASSVCLTSLSPAEVNRAYATAKKDSRTADIVITSHMMVLLEAKSSYSILGLVDGEMDHLLFDEADQVPAQAEPLSNRRLQIREVIRQVSDLLGKGSSGLDRAILAGIQSLRELDHSLQVFGSELASPEVILDGSRSAPGVLSALLDQVHAQASELRGRISRSSLHRQTNDLHTQEVLTLLDWVTGFNDPRASGKAVRAMAWSPVMNIPSLMVQQANPAMFVSRLWREMGLRVGFTSATLGATATTDDQALFVPFKVSLGIAADSVAVEVQLSPKAFGDMRITLAGPSIPKPVRRHDDEEGAQLNGQWLAYAAKMASQASESGPTLVLTASYSEARQLGRRLSALSPLVHQCGHSLGDVIEAFRAGESNVLITPAAWQGSSIRSLEGGQLVTNLVITRIPFLPPNVSAERLAAHLAGQSGRVSPRMAMQYERAKGRDRALIKLRQGIGRLIRQQGDVGHLWLCDPRFPRIGEVSPHRFFVRAIPVRFHDAYREAGVFSEGGCSRPANAQASEFVSEYLNL